MSEMLMEARGLVKHFPVRSGGLAGRDVVRAVDGVDLAVRKGETVGLVGESACGKTTLGRMALHLIAPTEGNVYWKMPPEVRERMLELEPGPERKSPSRELEVINREYSLGRMGAKKLRLIRKDMQMVFQDPYGSLDPRMLVKDIVGEPLVVHKAAKGTELRSRVLDLLGTVGLGPEHLYRYPHEFSGGQRQRVGIARALALDPEFLVLDEPTSALDVSVQAQTLNLLNDLQDRLGLSYLFISHDLSVVRYMCDRVNVMYLGKIVESAPKEELFAHPRHPYTGALLSSIPDPERPRAHAPLPGEVPSPADLPVGCRFRTRCPCRQPICEREEPGLCECKPGHWVACHFWDRADPPLTDGRDRG